MSTQYGKAVKGKLSFKGSKDEKAKERNEKRSRPINKTENIYKESTATDYEIKIDQGVGRITSSSITVQGHGTTFMEQLSIGDAITVTHPTSLQEETKIVRMVLSNVSIGISSAFSTDLISTTPFRFIKAPKDEVNEEEILKQEVKKKHKVEESAFGTYASEGGEKLVYRVKKPGAHGGYKIVTEKLSGSSVSREDLLDMRKKKKADRLAS